MSQVEIAQPKNSDLGRVVRAASLVMVLFVVSRGLGLLREVVIARQFGTSAEMDAYWAAFRLPDFIFYVVAGGALGSAFIPVFTGYLSRDDLAGAWRLASAVLNWLLISLTLLSGLAAGAAPWLVATFLPEFSPAQQALTVELMRWMLISTLIFGASGVIMGILNARQHFFLPALAPVVYNIAIILGAWYLGPRWGVRGLTAGVVLGAAGHLLVQLPGLIRHGMQYRPILPWHDADLRQVGRLMAPRILGLAAVQLNFVVTTVLASGLAVGSITALNYGWIIMLLPQGIIAQSVATALFPTLAGLAAQGRLAELRRIFGLTLRNLLFLTLPAAAGLIVLAEPIVRLLLQRGRFGPESTELTAWALGFFALGLVGHAVVEIVARAFYALKNTKTPVAAAVAAVVINIGLSLALMKIFARYGWPPHAGLALANAIAITLEMVLLLGLLRARLGGLAEPGLGRAAAKMSLATLGMVLLLLALLPWLPQSSHWPADLSRIALAGIIYLGLALALRMEELTLLLSRVRGVVKSGQTTP
jgi:putative peptidoglycan lipid II flippase